MTGRLLVQRWRGAALVALLFLVSCRTVERHTTTQREQTEEIKVESRTATSIETETQQTLTQRTWVWSVMERDTATGKLVETRRETVTETSVDTTSRKIENKAQNSDSSAFSQKSEVITQDEQETPSNRRKSGWRYFLWGFIAANVVAFVFLLVKKHVIKL